jgi:hypothetical protein
LPPPLNNFFRREARVLLPERGRLLPKSGKKVKVKRDGVHGLIVRDFERDVLDKRLNVCPIF